MADTSTVRLNKYLAECGVCSRREADVLIEAGKVIVNGRKAEPGMRVSGLDEVICNGKALKSRNEKVVLAYYKPLGVTCTEKDRFADKTLKDAFDYPIRVTYAGRLDKETEGLLLITNDGDLIQRLMRGTEHHEKEYVVKVNKEISPEFIADMEKGVFVKELEQTTRPCTVKQIGKYTFHIILTQGLNRQIRRMCKTLGYEVTHLKRIRIMNVELGKLLPGKYRELTGEELEELYLLAGMKKN